MELRSEELESPERLERLEWLEPNGRAGFACGTLAGPPGRRWHALFQIALEPPHDHVVLVNHLEQRVDVAGERFALGVPMASASPGGRPSRLVGFGTWPWALWTFQVGPVRITREVLWLYGQDVVAVRWRLESPEAPPCRLHARPFLTGRPASGVRHVHGQGWERISRAGDEVVWEPSPEFPRVHARSTGVYAPSPHRVKDVVYRRDEERGEPHREDWWSPGELVLELRPGASAWLVLSTAPGAPDADSIARSEWDRRRGAIRWPPSGDRLFEELARSSMSCVSRAPEGMALLAGYPWFGPWARDTFTALGGLCMASGHYEIARQVFLAYMPLISKGMVPHKLPRPGELPQYEDIDTSLWFIRAVGQYLAYSRDDEFVRRVTWPAVRQIIEGYRRGTHCGIHVDRDGLVTGGGPGQKLTWMDARYEGWVVTPRHGKPVEVQALWTSALQISAILARRYGEPELASGYEEDRRRAIASFRARFWYAPGGYLYDVVDGERGDDPTLRPNQLFAVAREELVDLERARRVVAIIEEKLLTPVGLRTLPRGAPCYHPRYVGPRSERDPAYHQGTVWPFLFSPFIGSWLRVHGSTEANRRRARRFLDGVWQSLSQGCVGHMAELFDAEPPHLSRGCFAQAWSTGEILLTLAEDILQIGAPPLE